MFSLGEKFRVLNTNADVTFFEGTNVAMVPITAVTTNAAITATIAGGGYFKVLGFGKFPLNKLVDFRASRAKAASSEVAKFTTVVPTGTALGTVIEARITLATERYQGELANNYIIGGRPIVIQTQPLTAGILATNVTDAIKAAYDAYVAVFNKANFPLSGFTNVGGDLVSTMSTGYESVSVSKIEISISVQGSGSFPKIKLTKVPFATYGTQGSQGRGLGKFLEESIRVGTSDNVRTYGMNANSDTTVDLRGAYSQFNWRMTANYDEPLGNNSSDSTPFAEHNFTLFLNEATTMTMPQAIGQLAALVSGVGLPASVAVASGSMTTTTHSVTALLDETDASVGGGTFAANAVAFI